ncbi:MAG TPA: DALR anticodon-binding domain-containing protein, partial [Pseudoxanthomonas sp.]|nr:DALR anticodon-binding domain-containing protein [Pseudoxanthomonas sp.]
QLSDNNKELKELFAEFKAAKARGFSFSFENTAPSLAQADSHVREMLPSSGELYDFILDRLRGYYADKGAPASHFNAVAELRPHSLYDFDTRLDAIGQFATLPEAEALAAANKRINNILKKADVEIPHAIDRNLLNDPAESSLAEAVEAALGDTDEALHHHDYIRVLSRLALLRPQVDAFFDSVMVNVEDPAIRTNRLALLKRLADRFRAVAAIEHLSS